MKYIFGVLLLITPSFLLAQTAGRPDFFSGVWSGRGTYILSGEITTCTSFEMSFNGDQDSFEFVSGSRGCEKHNETFAPVKMVYRNGGLYFGAQKVGEINGNVLTAAFSLPESGGRVRNWRMSMRREGDHMVYEESRTMQGEVTPLISFAGLLIRVAE